MMKRMSCLLCLGAVLAAGGVAVGAPLAPDDASLRQNLCLWLRMPEVNYDPGAKVWTDVSGKGHDACATVAGFVGPTLSSGANPTVFAHPFSALHFSPTVQDLLKTTGLNGGASLTQLTIFSVEKLVTAGSVDQRAVGFGCYQDGNRADAFNLSFDVTVRKNNGNIPGKNQDHPLNAFVIYAARMDPARINMWFNSTGTLSLAYTATGSSYTVATDLFYVGDLRYTPAGDFDVAEVVVFNTALTDAQVAGVSEWLQAYVGAKAQTKASGSEPANGATDVPRDAILTWAPVESAVQRDVYVGTVFADVNNPDRAHPTNVLLSQGQTATTYDPAGRLAYGQTYYWRIDEVNKAPDNTIFKGDVWSFTVEPYAYPIKPASATASSAQASMGPEKTIDGSGLTGDLHGTEPTTMWLSTGTAPNWIQYEFDKVYKLYDLKVWNSNQLIEAFVGFGAKNVTIEYSPDGTTWKPVANVPEFARASGTAGYAANITVALGGIEAKYVKLTLNSSWRGIGPTGLSEVRFSYVPVQARLPQPATAATGISVDTDLNWRPGREAASHKVYFGTDPNAVAKGTAPAKTVTDHSYSPGALNLGTTYYWRVDEVNAVTYPGDVWSFTTEAYQVVDDFESYTDEPGAEIFSTWIDGFADNYKSSGSTVGLDTAKNGTFGETTIFHGGKQSMPLAYDNTKAPNYSEAVLTFATPQDWTASGIKSLSVWFQGVAGNGGQLYVKINSTKVLYDGDAADLARTAWQVWNVDLSKAGKVNSVRSLTIGVEGAGTKGTLYIDDIRLYPKTPEYITPIQPAATDLAAYYTFDEGSGTRVGDSSGKGNHGTANGNPQWVKGILGGAMSFDGVDDFVDCGNNASVTSVDSVSVAAWIKVGVLGRDHKIASNQNGTTGGYKLGVYTDNKVEFEIRDSANAATLNRTAPGGTVLQTDTWYHVVGVYEKGKALRTYVNGRLDRELLTTVVAGISNGALMLGRQPPAGANWWSGQMDDVRIYSRVLSAAEVAGLAGQNTPLHKPF